MAQTVQQTFFWYDLETSGINPRGDRVMQFAGQRTTLALEPVAEPVNVMIKMTDDILPSPDAVMVTGITPQATIEEGYTEAEFLRIFANEIAVPGTIFAGFNSVRFDDEFLRFLHYRNYYDAYGWSWRDNRGRWDLLDVVRMTRALRPDGINWPVIDGRSSNRLELITKANQIEHIGAHDALSDVKACIAVARLIQEKQPKLFSYLFGMRTKQKVAELVDSGEPFVYATGKYDAAYEKTSVAVKIAPNRHAQGSLVYDLRHDPSEFIDLSAEQLVERWRWTRDPDAPKRLPVKTMQYNRCPAVAPMGVLDEGSRERLQISIDVVASHRTLLHAHPKFLKNIVNAVELMEKERAEKPAVEQLAEERLYDGFISDTDQNLMSALRAASPPDIMDISRDFRDERLRALALPYKARNYAAELTDDERAEWEKHRYESLMAGGVESSLARFMHRLSELAAEPGDTPRNDKSFLLEELQLYAESIMPSQDV